MIEYTKISDYTEIGNLERDTFSVIFTSLKDSDIKNKYRAIDVRTPRLPSYLQVYHVNTEEGGVTLFGEIETSSMEAKLSITGKENARSIVKRSLEEIATLALQRVN